MSGKGEGLRQKEREIISSRLCATFLLERLRITLLCLKLNLSILHPGVGRAVLAHTGECFYLKVSCVLLFDTSYRWKYISLSMAFTILYSPFNLERSYIVKLALPVFEKHLRQNF